MFRKENLKRSDNGIWFCSKPEGCSRAMNENFMKRLPLITFGEDTDKSYDDSIKEWFEVVDFSFNIPYICICGHVLMKTYLLKSLSGSLCRVGSECVKKINHGLIDEFSKKNKLKKHYYCVWCDKTLKNGDYEKHCLSKNHLNNEAEKLKNIEDMILKKFKNIKFESLFKKCKGNDCKLYLSRLSTKVKCIRCFSLD